MSKENKYTVWQDRVSIQPFGWDLFVVRPSSLAAFSKHLKAGKLSKKMQKSFAKAAASIYGDGGAMFWQGQVLILQEEWDEISVWHEALHVAISFWEDAGADLHLYKNQEVLTYTQGHVVKLLKEKFYPEGEVVCQSKK